MKTETNRAPAAPGKSAAQKLYESWQHAQPNRCQIPPWDKATPDARAEWEARAAGAAPVPASTGREEWNFAMSKAADACLRYAAAGMDAENIAGMIRSMGHLEMPAPVAARELDSDAERLAFEAQAALDDYRPLRRNSEAGNYTSAVVEACWSIWQAARATAESAPASAAPTCPIPGRQCACRACNPHMVGSMMFICPACGDKRCPNAADHRAGCPKRAPSNSPVGAKEQDK